MKRILFAIFFILFSFNYLYEKGFIHQPMSLYINGGFHKKINHPVRKKKITLGFLFLIPHSIVHKLNHIPKKKFSW